MTQPWFRFYRSAVNSPKVQRLPPALFKAWVNLLCCTGDDGTLPAVSDLAFTLRTTEREVAKMIAQLITAGLMSDERGCVTAHDWNEHQRKSDSSAERVKRHRERHKAVTGNVTRNAPEEETDTEAEEETVPSGTGGLEPPLPPPIADQIWKAGVPFLVAAGVKDPQARSMLGKWRKEHGDAATLAALIDAQKDGISEPVAWIQGVLRNGKGQHGRSGIGAGGIARDDYLESAASSIRRGPH